MAAWKKNQTKIEKQCAAKLVEVEWEKEETCWKVGEN